MASTASIEPRPFSLEGGPIGCLLLHGLTGSPPEMRLLGDYLHAKGLTVTAPLLPGHGTAPADLHRTTWHDWAAAAARSCQELRERVDVLFVAGLSMGALLAAHLASERDDLAGITLYAPALRLAHPLLPLLPLLRPFIRYWPKEPPEETDLTDPEALDRLWAYDCWPTAAIHQLLHLQREVRQRLPRIRIPALVIHSTRDGSIHPQSALETFQALASPDKELIALHNSGHCLTIDSERDTVFARTYGFIVAHAGGGLDGASSPADAD